jgi:hypothetical protein
MSDWHVKVCLPEHAQLNVGCSLCNLLQLVDGRVHSCLWRLSKGWSGRQDLAHIVGRGRQVQRVVPRGSGVRVHDLWVPVGWPTEEK